MKETLAVEINCMDGRIQNAVRKFMKNKSHIDYVDMVTETGPNRILVDRTKCKEMELKAKSNRHMGKSIQGSRNSLIRVSINKEEEHEK